VENSGGISASLQGRYASALFELAHENKAVATVEQDLGALGQALAESADLAALIRNPQVGREAAAKAIDSVATLLKLSPLTKQFLGVLAANGRLDVLPRIVDDPAILGGLVVKIGSTQIDSSIRTRLNSLAQAMKG
jgi:F-type H+-transporting ATPase subunit delta